MIKEFIRNHTALQTGFDQYSRGGFALDKEVFGRAVRWEITPLIITWTLSI
jgi:hypothetical protein